MKIRTKKVSVYIANDNTEHATLEGALRADLSEFCKEGRRTGLPRELMSPPEIQAWLVEHRGRLAALLSPGLDTGDDSEEHGP